VSHADSRKRYREIARVLGHYGFEWLWSDWGIGRVLGAIQRRIGAHEGEPHTQAVRLRLACEELGTTFIKVGQILSTRPDLMPQDYVAELSKLQDHAPAVAYEDIAAAIERELGGPPESVFNSFEREARAAGSIAQVHGAVLPGGEPVVVKVRRPGIESLVEQDLAILGQMARFLTHSTDLGKKLDLEGLVDEFGFALRNELDLTREGQNAERIAAEFVNDPCLHVPKIFWEFSTHTVLTMEDIHGVKIDDLAALDAAGIDRHVLAERCAHIALVQVLDHGFFHADPHPGNFFVHSDGVVALIDYGMVGRLDKNLRESLVRLALAVTRQDSERLIDELLGLGAAQGSVNRQALRHDLDHLLAHYDGVPLGEISAGQLLRDIAATSQRHWLKLPADLVMVIRVIAMDEGMGANLDPGFNLIEFAQPYFKEFWKKNHSLRAMSRRIRDSAIDFADVGLDLPKRLLRLVGMLERGELAVTSRLEHPEALTKHVERAANRIAMSVITGGLLIALSILALAYRPAGSEGFGLFLLRTLLALGVLSGTWLAYAFWKSSR